MAGTIVDDGGGETWEQRPFRHEFSNIGAAKPVFEAEETPGSGIGKNNVAGGIENEHRHRARLQECKDLGTKHHQPNRQVASADLSDVTLTAERKGM
jgi:hypothetical protein